jgi:hypothetical protein
MSAEDINRARQGNHVTAKNVIGGRCLIFGDGS